MSTGRHKTIQFNPTDWLARTARMPRIVRGVFFDVCVFNWERAEVVPASEVFLMLSDLPEGQGAAIIENLVQGGHLIERPDGGVYSPEAMDAAGRAYELWQAKSRGGRGRVEPSKPEFQTWENEEPEVERAIAAAAEERIPPAEPERPVLQLPGGPEIVEVWNAIAGKTPGLKQVVKMTAERQGRLNARIAEHGADAIIAAIHALPGNEIVLATKPSFDTLLQPETCAKMVAAACAPPVEN